MARTQILEALGVDGSDSATIDTHEPIEQLPLPTLDERASVYLRAVHGERDFTGIEHANARDLILEVMAADIAARDTWVREIVAREAVARDLATRDVATRDVAAGDIAARDIAARDVATRSDSRTPNAVLQD